MNETLTLLQDSAGVDSTREQTAMQASMRAGYAQAVTDVMGTLNRYRKV